VTPSLEGAERLRDRWRLPLLRWLYPQADAIVAISHGVADDLVTRVGVRRDRITVIHNPVDIAGAGALAAEPLDHPWFAPGEPPVVLAAGRLVAQKDFFTMLDAFARVRARRPVRLVVLGDGPLRAALRTRAETLGVAADAAFPGFAANPFRFMARAGVFALSSRWEGFGVVLVEALACGCPVVSTDCPSGPAEILEHGRWGALVPVGDPARLAEALAAALDDPEDADARRRRAADFAPERALPAYAQVLGVENPGLG